MTFRLVGAVSFALVLLFSTFALGDEKAAEELLKTKGLKKFGNTFVVVEESAISKAIADLRKLQREVSATGKKVAQLDAAYDNLNKRVTGAIQQQAILSAQLPLARSVQENNQIVGQLQSLSSQIKLAEMQLRDQKDLKEARSKANAVREAYVQQVLDLRKEIEKLHAKYAELAADPEVPKAIEEINTTAKSPLKLGPLGTLKANSLALKKMEDSVISEKIVLRRTPSDILMVSVVINGAKTEEFCVDTGASLICLPYKMALTMGIEIPDSAQTIRMQLADGRIVEGKLIELKSVRVGKFTLEGVECAVMGPELIEAQPLLGQSYLNKFSYKIDSDAATLTMTKIE